MSQTMFKSALGLALVALLSACGEGDKAPSSAESAAAPAAIQTLNIGLKANPPSMDPTLSSSLYDRQVYASIYDKLFDINEKGEIVPLLVKSYTVSEDGLVYQFILKENIKFHDGSVFNAEVVKFNLDRHRTHPTSRRKTELAMINEVNVIDSSTVEVILKQPFAPFLSILTDRAGVMVSQLAVEKHGEQYINNPVGSGPFLFKEQVKGSHVSLVKNPEYWRGVPAFDEVNYRVFVNGSAKVQNLRSGQLDIIDEMPARDTAVIKSDPQLQLFSASGLGYQGIYLNGNKPPFDNPQLRIAVNQAIDRDTLVKVLFGEHALAGNSPFSVNSFAHSALDKPPQVDAEEISRLLKAGGKPDGFAFTLMIVTAPESEQLGAIIQNMLKAHKIDMKLEKVDYAQMLEMGQQGQFQAMQLGWSGRLDPDQNTYDFLVTGHLNNYGRINDSQLDELLNQARRAANQDERRKLYDQAVQRSHDIGAYVYIYHQFNLFGVNASIKNFKQYPDGLVRPFELSR